MGFLVSFEITNSYKKSYQALQNLIVCPPSLSTGDA